MRAYKLLRKLHDGQLYPLFIHKTYPTQFGIWMPAECYPTKGFAIRKGWHCTFRPLSPHLSMRLANGEQRVWVECEVEDWTTYNRPESQGGGVDSRPAYESCKGTDNGRSKADLEICYITEVRHEN